VRDGVVPRGGGKNFLWAGWLGGGGWGCPQGLGEGVQGGVKLLRLRTHLVISVDENW